MRLIYALVLETLNLLLTAATLMIVIRDVVDREVAPEDGLTMTVLCCTAALKTFRIALLDRWRRSLEPQHSDETVFLFSTFYLLLLWTGLQVALRWFKPQRPVFGLVSWLTSSR